MSRNPIRFFRAVALAWTIALAAAACRPVTTQVAPAPTAPPVAPAPAPVPVLVADPQPAGLPARLSDREFWALVTDISEPGGFFRITDNFTSNEPEIGQVFSTIRSRGVAGGVYIGVGPEQNLTYIAAIRPEMAFVVDIRRQAVMQHLMYKAMFELSRDRADFITMLFARPRPPGIDSTTPIDRIWAAYRPFAMADPALATATIERVETHLTKTHGFTFTADEASQLRWVLESFQLHGPEITTRGGPGGGGGARGGFAMLTGYALDSAGTPRSFLSTEENFRVVKALQERNLVVPVSGDFGGPKAVRAMGAWLTARKATVSAFYVSNVEQYLFQDGKADAFYANTATLPLDEKSVFIRPYSLRGMGGFGGGSVVIVGSAPAPTPALCPMVRFLERASAGQVRTNGQALACAP